MLTIFVLDKSAEARNQIVQQVNSLLQEDLPEFDLIPRINLKPISLQELKFNAAPDLCIVGDQIITEEITELANIRKILPDTPLLVRLNSEIEGLAFVEQLARLGADDTMSICINASEFLRKIILLARKVKKSGAGKLIIVDSGKGGVGVTSVAAAMAEAMVEEGKKVVLIDFDFETQDLSRFLQARPFINENLQLLFDKSRLVTSEFVEQCLVPVWQDEPSFLCMAPVAESDSLYDTHASYARILLSILEVLDASADCVIVDRGCVRGALLKTLYRVADKAVFVVNNDPASLYASIDRVSKVRQLLSPNADLLLLENASSRVGLPEKLFRQEFLLAAGLEDEHWCAHALPYCKAASRWPGSGATLLSLGKTALGKSVHGLLENLELKDNEQNKGRLGISSSLIEYGKQKLLAVKTKPANAAIKLPAKKTSGLLPAPEATETKPINGNLETIKEPKDKQSQEKDFEVEALVSSASIFQ